MKIAQLVGDRADEVHLYDAFGGSGKERTRLKSDVSEPWRLTVGVSGGIKLLSSQSNLVKA
jgi:hypothetical protein